MDSFASYTSPEGMQKYFQSPSFLLFHPQRGVNLMNKINHFLIKLKKKRRSYFFLWKK